MANIYEKLLAVMQNVKYLNKDDSVEFKSTKYKALSEEKVTSIMREQFIAQKLLVFPIEMQSSRDGQISHVDVRYRILNVEDPTEYIDVVSCGDGADTQDKGAGKAMTYAFKYMWLRTLAIPTGEDPDKISSEELTEKFKKEEPTLICESCNRTIGDDTRRDGSLWPAEEIAVYSQKMFGKTMCKACQKESLKLIRAAEKASVKA